MNPIIIHHRGLGVLEERLTVYPGPLRFKTMCIFVLCMHTFVGPPACVHAHPVCVSALAQSVCPCTAALPVHTCIASWYCPHVPARHCGSRSSLAPPAEACDCLPGGPRTLTQGPSLQLEQAVRLESGELETQEPRGLARQSVELRRQLQEEQASYRRKLQAYQEGQQRQAQLVQRLQAKVRATHSCSCPPLRSLGPAPMPPGADRPLSTHPQILQYKKKTSELEQQLLERAAELGQQRLRVGAGLRQGRRFPPRCPA